MPHTIVSSIVVLGIVSIAAAQGPIVPPSPTPPKQDARRDTEFPIVVNGCVRGTRLTIDPARKGVAVDYLRASEFVLEGPKEVLRQLLRGHDGHEEEVSGIAIIPVQDADDRHVVTKELGTKTRVTAGSGSSIDEPGRLRRIRLRVEGVTHVENKCGF